MAVQHYKLSERFRLKERQTTQLQHRVEQLESRQAQDDAMMCIINRFWNLVSYSYRIHDIFSAQYICVSYVALHIVVRGKHQLI